MSQTRFHRIIHWLVFSIPLAAAAAISVLLLSASPSVACGPNCDMPGDRGGVAHYINSAVACESTCDGTPGCVGWTWVKPGVQGPQAVCWIKKQIVHTMRSNCCISGYRGDHTAAESVRVFGYGDLPAQRPAPPAPAQQRALPPAPGPTTNCYWKVQFGGNLDHACVCGGVITNKAACGPGTPVRD